LTTPSTSLESGRAQPKGLSPALGCGLALLLALAGGALCLGFGALLLRDQITLPGGGPAPGRLWLVREGNNQGLGLSTSRVVEGSRDGPRACVETRVRFLLWRSDGTSAPTAYCECFAREAEEWIPEGVCAP
jgi:hypothetical protein